MTATAQHFGLDVAQWGRTTAQVQLPADLVAQGYSAAARYVARLFRAEAPAPEAVPESVPVDNPDAPMWLDDVYSLVRQEHVDEAIDLLFSHVDQQLASKNFEACDNLLMTIDVGGLDTNLLVALLSITYPARQQLQNRDGLVRRAEGRLNILARDRVERLMAGRRQQPPVEPEDLAAVAAMCRLVLKRFRETRWLPYSLRFLGSTFDERGCLQLAEGAQGLTCATFVLAVFRSVQRSLVDENSWPSDRLEADLKFVVMATAFGRRALLERLRAEAENGLRRIHPHELVGACLAASVPASFGDASVGGLRVLNVMLDGLIERSRA